MPGTTERWTAAQVRAFPDDGNRYELIDGELVVGPAPGRPHQAVLAALFARIAPFVRSSGAGVILWSPADISLGEDEILQPDLFVYRSPSPGPHEWTDITELLLVIEALSPSTARYDRQLKRRRYQRARVPEYWIVDTDARLIERWRPEDARPEILGEKIIWQPDAGSPGLEIDLGELFVEIWGK